MVPTKVTTGLRAILIEARFPGRIRCGVITGGLESVNYAVPSSVGDTRGKVSTGSVNSAREYDC
jgi:hypothetical protein